jgi:hypothetical protein
MRKILKFNTITIVLLLCSFYLYADIDYDSGTNTIRIYNTNVTGNELRSWIPSNVSSVATVYDRDIYFNCNLRIESNYYDENANYQFEGNSYLSPQNTSTIGLRDVMVLYTGSPKGQNLTGTFTANFTRVHLVQSVPNGSSDFFSNGNHNLNFNEVKYTVNSHNDHIYLKSNSNISGLIVTSNKGSDIQIGSPNDGQEPLIDGLQLNGINNIVGSAGANGDVILKKLDWNDTVWNFNTNNVDIKIVDPIKPEGWKRYAGNCQRVKEYKSHKVKVLDVQRIPLVSCGVKLWNEKESVFDYQTVTNTNGEIHEQEILKLENQTTLNNDRSPWRLIITSYSKELFNRPRDFENSVDEEIIILDDRAVTEKNSVTVQNYSKVHDANNLYDLAKLWKVKSENIATPSLNELLIKRKGNVLELAPNWNLVLDSNSTATFSVNKLTSTLTIKSPKLLPSNKYNKLLVSGDIIFNNNEEIDFPYADSNHDSYVRFVDLKPDDEVILKTETGTILKTMKGECGYSYKSVENKKIIVELKRHSTGDASLRHYSLSNKGLDNFFRMGISEIYMETMFNRTDRNTLFNVVKGIMQIEDEEREIDEILTIMRFLIHKVQPNPKRYQK